MRTQADVLKSEIKELESKLAYATQHLEAFQQISIYKQIEIKRSILTNIR